MNEFLSILFGGFIYILMMWLLLAVMRLDKTPYEQEQDDEEQAAAVSKPAPLTWDNAYSKRPHIRAGGKQ